jgi:hypothetical protein
MSLLGHNLYEMISNRADREARQRVSLGRVLTDGNTGDDTGDDDTEHSETERVRYEDSSSS